MSEEVVGVAESDAPISETPIFGPTEMDDTDYLSGDTIPDEALERFGLAPETDADGDTVEAVDGEDDDDSDDDGGVEVDEDDTPDVDDAEIGKRVREMLASDRAGLAKFVLEGMTPEERRSLVDGDSATDGASADGALGLPDPDDVNGAWEASVVERINAMPQVIEKQATEVIGRVAPYVDGAAATGVIAMRMARALAEAMGIELPEVKVEDISKVARTGKTWDEAFDQVAGKPLKKAVSRAQRARTAAARPSTLGAQGQGMPEAKYGDSMTDIARKLLGRA